MIVVNDLTVWYPRRREPTLRDLTIQINAGEQAVILGPSGCGKSTLLHALSGVVPHAVSATLNGDIRIGAGLTERSTVIERSPQVAIVGQDPATSVCLPQVAAEVGFVLENAGVPPEQIPQQVRAALAVVGLADLAERQTAELSGGQLQRVALAAAIVARPEVLLLDEPTAMLDADGIAAVRAAIAAAAGSYRPTVVLVEHRLDEFAGPAGIGGLPGRTIAIDDTGQVLADGSTTDVLRQHAAALRDMGCWLPLDAELAALTGRWGTLSSGVHDGYLTQVVDRAHPGSPDTREGQVLLEARNLTVGHGERPVLGGIELVLRSGQVTALLGANAAGKSTLLAVLAGLAPSLTGSVRGPRPGLIFQHPEHQLLARTVESEVAYGLSGQDRATVPALLAAHRLDGLGDHHPHRLSGGQQRRLSLAAMLAHERPVLLADEVTFGLDRRDAHAAVTALAEVAGQGRAVLFASHDLRLVAQIAHRIVIVGQGGVLADDDALAVLRQPELLDAAGVYVPELLRWLVSRVRSGAHLRAVLRHLGAASSTRTRPSRTVSRGAW